MGSCKSKKFTVEYLKRKYIRLLIEAGHTKDALISLGFDIKNQFILTTRTDVIIYCPHCDHWECMPIDKQRHHIQSFNIIEWLPDEENLEVSIMECHICKNQFRLFWKYD